MLSIKIPSRQSFRVITFCQRKLSAITLTFGRIGFISNHVCTLTVALRLLPADSMTFPVELLHLLLFCVGYGSFPCALKLC